MYLAALCKTEKSIGISFFILSILPLAINSSDLFY